MTDLILQIGASKLAISVVLAVGILALTWRLGQPTVAHRLWLLLLGALLVPPLVSIPVLPSEAASPASVTVVGFLEAESTVSAGSTPLDWLKAYGPSGLIWLWFLGTASVLGWTLVRALRFHGSLVRASAGAPVSVQRMARRISGKLGLKAVPAIHTTEAQLSPMVWWAGGKVRVLLPSTLIAEMDAAELRCVLVHELAHIRRRDHLVRWLEWLACTAFWWNPVAWWARRKLRAAEELCCDALALASSDVSPRAYARSLLRAIDLVSDRPSATAPAFASTAHGRERVNSLEQRFRMIVSNTPSPSLPTRLRTVFRFGAVGLLAAGLIYCSDQGTPVEPKAAASTSTTDLIVSATDVDGDGNPDLYVGDRDFFVGDAALTDERSGGDVGPRFEDLLDTLFHEARLPSEAFESVRPVVVSDIATQLLPLKGQQEYRRYAGLFGPDGEETSPMMVTVDLQGLRGALAKSTRPDASSNIIRDYVSVHRLEGLGTIMIKGSAIDCFGIGRDERYARLDGDDLRCRFWDGVISVDGEQVTPPAASPEIPSGSGDKRQ